VARTTRALAVFIVAAAIATAFLVSRRTAMPRPVAGSAADGSTLVRGGELVASLRSEPATYNRYVDQAAAGEVLSLLTQAPLVRVDRTTDTLEPWLAQSWTQSPDGLTYTIKLRPGITFSDGTPFTSADVIFSFAALYDPRVHAVLAADTYVSGRPLHVQAPDASTVVVRLPAPFAAGLRLIDGIPILPRHKLKAALDTGRFGETWSAATLPGDLAGLGPFVLAEHVSGQRLVFTRNPRYWRKDAAGVQLPYLDKLTVLIVPDQSTEALRMQAGDLDLMASGEIRPDDYVAFKRIADQGRLRLIDAGVGVDPNLLWFNLSPVHAEDPRNRWLRSQAFRQAVSCAIDRDAIVNTVYLGAAVPIYGPITPGNRTWYAPVSPACEHDRAKARDLFAAAGLSDRNGDGKLEDAAGAPARFSILTQRGHSIRERTVAMLQEQLRQAGIAVDVVTLDPGGLGQRWSRGDYDSIYFGVQATATDPTLNAGFWRSSGNFHFWHPRQATPSTDWERKIDDLMERAAAAPQLPERQRLIQDAQRIFVDQLPGLYFVAPKVTLAISSRLIHPLPAPQIPQLLWSADTLAATGGAAR
jgi:peptide/nickel transport system substrate-binding protein